MAKSRSSVLLSCVLLLLTSAGAAAQERDLLYSKSASDKLLQITNTIRNLKSEIRSSDQLTRQTDYFVRIAPRKYILDENGKLKDDARLGARPFVFITTPESVFGLSLLDIYLGIGYEAEDIIRSQRDEEMVMIVFKYAKEVVTSEMTSGRLPDGWDRTVYNPTWGNMFSLFHRLALQGPGTRKESACYTDPGMSKVERDFVLRFSARGKRRIETTSYGRLKAAGGRDWKYRMLLEQKLSVFQHFRGNGETQNEVADPEGVDAGLIEFVGPNCNLKELSQVTIIHLGKLIMEDSYGGGCTLCRMK